MFASPFFTSGRAAILPAIASAEELHTANSLTQTTQMDHTRRSAPFSAASSVSQFGFQTRRFGSTRSRFCSPRFASRMLRLPSRQRVPGRPRDLSEDRVVRPWHEYARRTALHARIPLILGIGLVGVGWATGGGAAQILFSLFGELVFNRGAGRNRRDLGLLPVSGW